MNVGREIIAALLSHDKNIQLLLDVGLNKAWLEGFNTGSEVIFVDDDKRAYDFILSHYRRHRKVPSLQLFRESFPEVSYKLPTSVYTLEELAEVANNKINSYLMADLIGRMIDLHDKDKIPAAVTLLKTEAPKFGNLKAATSKGYDLTDAAFDVNKLLDTQLEMGIPFGFVKIDNAFYGFQPGQLITLLGRQKSGKSWATLYSALQAWRDGYTVLFYSVEMDTQILWQRLHSMGAHVSPSRMRRGHLRDSERKKVIDFDAEFKAGGEGRFVVSKKHSMITVDDITEEINLYNPHIVYIDGFSFMVDRQTGKMTDDWQANENVAAELKALAMDEEIVVFVNTQVQEKQYQAKHGIEARTIQGGTGLLKASDLVIGQDKENNFITFNCIRSRFEDFNPVVLEVDWDCMVFTEIELPDLDEMGV